MIDPQQVLNINIMQSECEICRNAYNLKDRYVIKFCPNKHVCCNQCFDRLCRTNQDIMCPFCRQLIRQIQIDNIEARSLHDFKIGKVENIRLQFYQQMRIKAPEATRRWINSCIWNKYKELEQQHDFQTAISFLKRLIELDPDQKGDTFIGLGSYYEQVGFSERQGYQWYENHYKLPELSLYDQLTVALLVHGRSQFPDYQWRKTLKSNPANYKLLFWQLIFKHVNAKVASTIEACYNIIRINPQFDKTYEMIAFSHLYEEKFSLAKQFAIQCLKRNPHNIFAKYILTIADKDLAPSQVQENLLQILQKEPTYVRVLHSYGKELLKEKRQIEALECFQKCLQINPHYHCTLLDKAVTLILLQDYTEGKKILQLLLHKKYYAIFWRNFHIGTAYEMIGSKKKANEYYKLISNYLSSLDTRKLANFYWKISNYEFAVKYYTTDHKEINDIHVIQRIVKCYQRLKQYLEMSQWLYKWHLLENQNLFVILKLGKCSQTLGWYEAAISWHRKYLNWANTNKSVHKRVISLLHLNDECRQSLQQTERFRMRFTLTNKQLEELYDQDMKNYNRLKELRQKKDFA